MKKSFLIFLLTILSFVATAQPAWTWLKGDAFTGGYGVYGTKGVAAPANRPAARVGSVTWRDKEGNIWLFGGNGTSANGAGYLNDLWKYTPSTGLWTWVSGDLIENQFGNYGSRGVASPSNNIRARAYSTSWTDAQGNFWLYGGQGFDATLPSGLSIYFDDLWQFSPSSQLWTWMGGHSRFHDSSLYAGNYGTKGVSKASNQPSSKVFASGWTDTAGKLWLFGGIGYGFAPASDLWTYDISTGLWTLMNGDSLYRQPGRYGSRGIPSPANRPMSRYNATSWTDKQGNLWLFGGNGARPGATGFLNDLWMYSITTNEWTWASNDSTFDQPGNYGLQQVTSTTNKPGSRSLATGWTDATNNFWLYGGAVSAGLYNNDLWRYSPSTNQWAWFKGDTLSTGHRTVFGQKGIGSDSTQPPAQLYSPWTDEADNLYMGNTNYQWKYTPGNNQWTWISGDTTASPASVGMSYPGVYGTKGMSSPANLPPSRKFAATWKDTAGNFWMYGGEERSPNMPLFYNDLWKYTPATNEWTWIKGDSTYNRTPVFGTQGVPADSCTPGGRSHAAVWTDAAGNIWLFGGINESYSSSYINYPMGDLWKYTPSINQWTWISGSRDVYSQYTAINNDPATIHPGARFASGNWTDTAGNFWLFGGQGNAAYGLLFYDYGTRGKQNDLWKYSPATGLWTFIKGGMYTNPSGNNTSRPGEYGTKGVASSNNFPGGRSGSANWTDTQGNFWLYGGATDIDGSRGITEAYLSDLWRYQPSTGNWTWMSGDKTFYQPGLFGTIGVAAAGNKPGASRYANSWTDNTGNLYLFGGSRDTIDSRVSNGYRFFNDTWKYSITTGLWTWLSGDSAYNMPGAYGSLGTSSQQNKPGGRYGVNSWTDGMGNMWLFGGYGYPVNGIRYLNDMLKFSLAFALPVELTHFSALAQQNSVRLNWTTAQEQNSMAFIVERSADGHSYISIGRVAAAGNASSARSYFYADFLPLQGDNYYRLQEVDLDGKVLYSSVQKVHMGEEAASFILLSNPVRYSMQISIQLPAAEKLRLQVRDVQGKVLLSRTHTAAKGISLLSLPVDQLPAGTYFLQVNGSNLQSTKTFVKQ